MIRAARPGDEGALTAVYNACFPGEEGFCRWFFARVFRTENTLVWEEQGSLTAGVQLLPVTLALGERKIQATYIYAAGTLPRFRGKGQMAALLRQSFAVSAARGDDLSVLIAQEPSLLGYYARFGYRPVFARRRRTAQARPLPREYGMRPMTLRDIPAAQSLYTAAQSGLHAQRDEDAWRLIVEQYGENAVVLEDAAGGPVAFALLEGGDDRLCATEALGPGAELLMAAQAAERGLRLAEWFEPASGAGEENGCARPLSAAGAALLDAMPEPGYLNVLFN